METIRINYYVANKKKAISSLLISLSWDRKRLQIGIGLSIETSTFDYKKGRIKPGAPHSMEKNRLMENLSQDIRNYYYKILEDNQHVDIEILKEYVKSRIRKIEHPKVNQSDSVKVVEPEPKIPMHKLSILQLWEQFIQERRNNPKFTQASIKSYVTMKHHLERFLIATNYDLKFDTINESFCDKIVFYLAEEANLVNSTIERFFRVFKTLLNWAVENEFTTNIRWKKAIKQVVQDYKLKTESTIIALSNEEIALFESHEPSTQALRNARDLFLIQIFTGLRVSDIMRLKAGNISLREKKITIYQKKTNDPVTISIPQRLLYVLDRYPALRFPSMSEQRFNKLLKELGREAGLRTEIIIPSFYAKRRVDKTYKKWELISSHVARNTFVTYLIKKGVIPEMVMQISGHKSRAAFERYVKIAKAEAQHAVQQAWDE